MSKDMDLFNRLEKGGDILPSDTNMWGLCKKCSVAIPRGLKPITCNKCGEEVLVYCTNTSNICGYCSKESNICLICGKNLT